MSGASLTTDNMQVSSTKAEGRKILQKLRADEHVWLTVFNRSKKRERVKVELCDGEYFNRIRFFA